MLQSSFFKCWFCDLMVKLCWNISRRSLTRASLFILLNSSILIRIMKNSRVLLDSSNSMELYRMRLHKEKLDWSVTNEHSMLNSNTHIIFSKQRTQKFEGELTQIASLVRNDRFWCWKKKSLWHVTHKFEFSCNTERGIVGICVLLKFENKQDTVLGRFVFKSKHHGQQKFS